MALNNRNVEKAMEILSEVAGTGSKAFIVGNKKNQWRRDIIIVYGEVGDGWENVFINIEDIQQHQLDLFYDRRKEVHNSHFHNTKGKITSIGWF